VSVSAQMKTPPQWAGQKLCVLSFDRLTPVVLPVLQASVGQFRSAGGLVLLSGRKLGPQIPAARTLHNSQ
jgi:hypothetical protein